jgi:uncharacterized LabA/DUF88 family protein
MASSSDNISMAVFCDFENVALGVRDANYEKVDIKLVLERLLLKGSITVKKAYCDWDRYKGFKATMHEANFELIEIPHVRQSGKNSADIRLVVDALDLCYTKSHVNTFVIISGDSDFSPLVSKLRENNKQVIGVGVKQSTSDLLVANCDEFIFYDDLVREVRRAAAKRDERKAQPQPQQAKRPSDENNKRKEELEARKAQAVEMVTETFDALVSERGDSGKIWASLLKDTLKRRRPDFSETYYGFRTFGNLLEEAQARGLLEFGRDEKSGAYVFRGSGTGSAPASEQLNGQAEAAAPEQAEEAEQEVAPEARQEPRRGRGRGTRKGPGASGEAPAVQVAEQELAPEESQEQEPQAIEQEAAPEAMPEPRRGRGRGRGGRNGARDEAPAAQQPSSEYVAPEELQAFAPRSPAPAPEQEPQAAAPEAAEAAPQDVVQEQPAPKERRRAPRKTAYRTANVETPAQAASAVPAPAEPAQAAPAPAPADEVPASFGDLEMSDAEIDTEFNGNVAATHDGGAPAPRKRAPRSSAKPAARSRRPAKPKASDNG